PMDVGTRFNVIAENAALEGTVRCFSVTTRNGVEHALQRYAEQTAASYAGRASLDYQYGTLPVINDERDALFAQTLI
ncbi:amidohydrolase, partial [Enterococcus faecalis]